MGGPSSLDVFAPIANSMLGRIAALAARIGREAADCAILLFPLPMAPDRRKHFDAETIDAIADMLDEFGQLTPADREHFQQIATLALDRRLAHHAMQGMTGGRGMIPAVPLMARLAMSCACIRLARIAARVAIWITPELAAGKFVTVTNFKRESKR